MKVHSLREYVKMECLSLTLSQTLYLEDTNDISNVKAEL